MTSLVTITFFTLHESKPLKMILFDVNTLHLRLTSLTLSFCLHPLIFVEYEFPKQLLRISNQENETLEH